MIKFTKPQKLNGTQLRQELRDAGVTISDEVLTVRVDDNDDLWLEIADKDKAKATTVIAAHIGIDETPIKAAKKAALLERLGITEDEAKLLLS